MKVDAFLTAALSELGIYQAGEAPSGEDLDLLLLLFNELLDAWNSDEHAIYMTSFQSFTLTPGLNPHTIGIAANTPTFNVTGNRPVRISGANLILNTSTPNTYLPLTLQDDNWWLNQRVPTLQSGIPTDLFYDPDWPNGSIYLWPVPTVAYGLRLEFQVVLTQVTLITTFSMPPGYQQAARLTLAELAQPHFAVPMPQTLPQRAMEARARCWGNNTTVPRLATATAGLQQGGGSRGTWNYRTGSTT